MECAVCSGICVGPGIDDVCLVQGTPGVCRLSVAAIEFKLNDAGTLEIRASGLVSLMLVASDGLLL